jgi:asparagine synthetase B (glutamine-hydrolysing)
MRNSVDGCESILLALSGGLDSSTIASVSAHEGLSGITAYSLVHPTTPEFDESSWAEMVVRESGIPWHQIDIERILPFQAFPKVITGEPSIAHLHQSQKEAIEQIRTTTAANAVMTGSGGDVVLGTYIGSYPIFLTDLLFAGNLGSTWRMLRAWQKDCVLKRSLLHWITGGIVRPSLLHLRGKRQDTRPVQPPPNYMLIDAQSSSKFAPDLPRCRSPWLQMIAELLQKCAMSIASSRGIGHGPSIRTPLLYRPLVEFLLTLPIDFLYRSTVDRYLQRVALKGILPEKVRRRATKASGSWTLIEGLRQSHEWQDFLSDRSILSEMGLIDLEQWRQAVAMAKHGNTQGDMYFMASASAEIWLRMRADTQ